MICFVRPELNAVVSLWYTLHNILKDLMWVGSVFEILGGGGGWRTTWMRFEHNEDRSAPCNAHTTQMLINTPSYFSKHLLLCIRVLRIRVLRIRVWRILGYRECFKLAILIFSTPWYAIRIRSQILLPTSVISSLLGIRVWRILGYHEHFLIEQYAYYELQ